MKQNKSKPWIQWTAVLGFFIFFWGVISSGADNSVILKYTYRPEQTSVSLLQDSKGKAYLPLMETAKFYNIQLTFDPQTRKILLKKGGQEVKIILSQSFLLLTKPKETVPINPVEVVSGQLAMPVESVEDILSAALNINVRFLPDSQEVLVGGVSDSEIRQEILEQAKLQTPLPTVTPVYSLEAEPTATPRLVLEAVPTATPEAVIEALPTETATEEEDADETPAPIPGQDDQPPAQEVYQVRRIVIDAGHGGVDNGARGYDKRYVEKQATLDIAKRVVGILSQEKDLEVFMTRKADYYITLKYRTTFANSHNADLFVSIHCNANPNTSAYGTETFVYSSKASNDVAEVAAERENGKDDFVDFTLNDLLHHAFRDRSYALATYVDDLIRDRLGQKIRRPLQAPFYVLARVNMPSILIETAFITNPTEEEKLKDADWRDKMAHAIADAILAYKQRVEGSVASSNIER
jgi:N-acetylmuramoyl-L-alanine amidase